MKKLQGAAALSATWAASMALAANAGEVEVPALKSYDTLLYRLVTHDEYTASHIPGQTARIDAFLSQQLATPTHTPGLPTTIVLAITATALLPLSNALTGSLRPYMPTDWLLGILGGSALLALVALALPTRRALRSRPVEAIGVGE